VQAVREAVTERRFLSSAARGPLLLDGAMATCVHAMAGASGPVAACDHLSIAEPDRVRRVHDAYLEAHADIVRTNTFRAAARHHERDATRLCAAAARLAREAADQWSQRTPERPRFVAGALGPADRQASSNDARTAYRAPLRALLEGGVDLLLFETWYSAAHIAPALAAYVDAAADSGRTVPVLLSVSGVPIDDLVAAVDSYVVAGLGLNCGAGPEGLSAGLQALRGRAPLVTCHPSAGLPDQSGRYPYGPDDFARFVAAYAADGLADIVGGCCGTTPAHVAALARAGRQ
jgi:5-methyltetrahydrofolate--homocysteine methyltransferase